MDLGTILRFKYPDADLYTQIIIVNDGEGPKLHYWDPALGPVPTKQNLIDWALEVKAQADLDEAQRKRRAEYPSIGDQLDAILKQFSALKIAGTTLETDLNQIITTWQAIKDKYPTT